MISLRLETVSLQAFMDYASRYLNTLEVTMNAFCEHHQHNIRFHYRCFDRILLNGIIRGDALLRQLEVAEPDRDG